MTGMEVNSDLFCYFGGVYTYDYGDFVGNHAICVIGYDDTQNCWICKNSWGTNWGEDGFFKIAYGECGIGTEFPFYAVQMSSNPPAPTGYGVIVLKKTGPVNLKVQSLKNAHIRELDIATPAGRPICVVNSKIVGQNFNLGTFNAGDSLVFKIITDGGTFYSARSMNAGNANHMYLLPLGANKWQLRWAVRGSQFLDMVCSVTS
jgi:hypothetical protein